MRSKWKLQVSEPMWLREDSAVHRHKRSNWIEVNGRPSFGEAALAQLQALSSSTDLSPSPCFCFKQPVSLLYPLSTLRDGDAASHSNFISSVWILAWHLIISLQQCNEHFMKSYYRLNNLPQIKIVCHFLKRLHLVFWLMGETFTVSRTRINWGWTQV